MPVKTKIALDALSQSDNLSRDFGQLIPKTPIKNPGALFPRIEE